MCMISMALLDHLLVFGLQIRENSLAMPLFPAAVVTNM